MSKEEFIESNKYLRKAMKNLDQSDLNYLSAIAKSDIMPKSDDLRLKQLIYHMIQGLKPWDLPGFIKAFKTLEKL